MPTGERGIVMKMNYRIDIAVLFFALGVSFACRADVTLVSAGPNGVVAKVTPEPWDSGIQNVYIGARRNGSLYLRGFSATTAGWHLYAGGPFQVAGQVNIEGTV